MRAHVARLRAFLWRFQTLPYIERTFARWSDPPIRERRYCGGHLVLDLRRSNSHRLLYLEGERFVPERHLIRSLLKPGMRVMDVGANIGYFLLLFEQRIGARGFVTCLEPEPSNREELERNIERNGLRNVEVLAIAAGAFDGEASLVLGLNGVVRTDSMGDLTIPLRALDSLELDQVDFLKIDVEGFETSVLRGAERLLARYRPTVIVEVHPQLMSVRAELPEILQRLQRHHRATAFRVRPAMGVAAKVASRYLGTSSLEQVDVARIAEESHAGRQNDPFWVVATPRAPAA